MSKIHPENRFNLKSKLASECPQFFEVFLVFLKLGLTSFGGPIAHIGYYRRELVERRAWLSDQAFADLVSLCHFLPGPASSQTGMAIGYHRGGPAGAVAAFIAFTSPSAIIMAVCALAAQAINNHGDFTLLRGLELVAIAVVAQAVWGMQANLCADWPRRVIAVLAFIGLLIYPTPPSFASQISVILLGALLGGLFLDTNHGAGHLAKKSNPEQKSDHGLRTPSRKAGLVAAILTIGVLILAFGSWTGVAAQLAGIAQAGALVFGGGHVVLPLLESTTSTWIDRDLFFAGYGAAQALPGPLFSFAAYIGMLADWPPSPLFALLCLGAIFIPGFLLLFAALPFWNRLSLWRPARASMAGVNAAVVGLLAAALIDPLWVSSVHTPVDVLITLAAFILLKKSLIPTWGVVLAVALVCVIRAI